MTAPLTFDGPEPGPRGKILVLTHGAGAPSSHPSLAEPARLIGERGVRVARFDLPYMRRAAATGRRAWPPDDEEVLAGAWIEVLRELAPTSRLIIGGRSLGGRAASVWPTQRRSRGWSASATRFTRRAAKGRCARRICARSRRRR